MNSKNLAIQLLTIGGNRLELLAVEVEEAREHCMRFLLLAIGAAVFWLLAGITLTAAIVVWLWAPSPVLVLFILTGLYSITGIGLYWWLIKTMRSTQALAATIDQLKRDSACLKTIID